MLMLNAENDVESLVLVWCDGDRIESLSGDEEVYEENVILQC